MTPELVVTLEKWLVSDDPVERAHAVWRLAQGDAPTPGPAPIPLAESLALLRLVNSCPYRSRDAACGCSGHRCALRRSDELRVANGEQIDPSSLATRNSQLATIVSHLDCLDCVKRYG